jgi:hypothetical protein
MMTGMEWEGKGQSLLYAYWKTGSSPQCNNIIIMISGSPRPQCRFLRTDCPGLSRVSSMANSGQ